MWEGAWHGGCDLLMCVIYEAHLKAVSASLPERLQSFTEGLMERPPSHDESEQTEVGELMMQTQDHLHPPMQRTRRPNICMLHKQSTMYRHIFRRIRTQASVKMTRGYKSKM